MRAPATALAAAVVAGAIAVAGCGGSDAPVASTAAGGSGGGPASAPAASGRIASDAQKVIESNPQPKACAPGGLPADTGQATCQFFWNHMLMWQKGPDAATGPVLVGAGPNSMEYLGYRRESTAEPWWGPNLPTGCEGTGSIERNGNYCAWGKPGLEFGKSTLIEARSTGPEAKSVVSWYLEPGGVRLGPLDFMASSSGGQGGTQYAFCGRRAGTDRQDWSEWVSCSRANPEHDGAIINAAKASPDARPAASFGWVLETYPVLVRVTNLLTDTALVTPRAGAGPGVTYSPTASMWGPNPGRVHRLDGPRAAAGGSGPSGAEASWWVAGYRKRTGEGATVSVLGQLVVVRASGVAPSRGLQFLYRADLTQLAKTAGSQPQPVGCLGNGRSPSARGRCLVRFSPGGPSAPAVVEVTLVPGAATTG